MDVSVRFYPHFGKAESRLKKAVPITLLSLAAAALACLGYARFIEPDLLTEKHYRREIPGLSKPVTVAFFSDTHFGKNYSDDNIFRIAEKINAAKPDLILFGGDFFDSYYRDQEELDLSLLQSELAQMEAPLGKFAVLGNHDWGGGAHQVYPEVLEAGGFSLLINEGISLPGENLWLYGADDMLLGSPEASSSVPNGQAGILLSHEPDQAETLLTDGIQLALSGHSHGGQVRLPFVTNKILPTGAQQYVRGWYTLQNQVPLLVSSGIGTTVLPFRFASPPEICILELVPASS